MRRKEERNKRKAEEREKLKHLKETHQDADVPSKIATHGTGDSIHTQLCQLKIMSSQKFMMLSKKLKYLHQVPLNLKL